MDARVKHVTEDLVKKSKMPVFKPGDNVSVAYKIKEGDKERTQVFKGDVIQMGGSGTTRSFTVRKLSNGVGVERIFPLFSPFIEKITVNKSGKVRRAKLFYLRDLTGKASRIREKKMTEE